MQVNEEPFYGKLYNMRKDEMERLACFLGLDCTGPLRVLRPCIEEHLNKKIADLAGIPQLAPLYYSSRGSGQVRKTAEDKMREDEDVADGVILLGKEKDIAK